MSITVLDKRVRNAVASTYETLLRTGAWKATKYLSERTIVRVTRKRYEGKKGYKFDGRDSTTAIVLTVGRPNYLEAKFIKMARKSGEPFPIGRVQLKFLPVMRPKV